MNLQTSESTNDLSALAWVHDELRRSLEAAHKSLRRYLKDAEAARQSDVDDVDPGLLRSARVQIHQGVGALELVGLRTAATVLRASESAVSRFASRPATLTLPVVEDLERASFALLDYLARMLAGKPVSALAMFPQYRAVQEAASAQRVQPADLWNVDWRWLELPASTVAAPRQIDADTRKLLEGELLKLMRDLEPRKSAARMSELFAGLGTGGSDMREATLWKLASAVFEAQARGLLPVDVFSKRVAARLLAQFRALENNRGAEVSDRLAQDLLFFCAHSAAPDEAHRAHRLASVRQVYGLDATRPVDYTRSMLGQFDPAWIAQARKRVAAAKESWSAVAGGEMHRLAGLNEQFTLVGESLKRLFPKGELLGTELLRSVGVSQTLGEPPPATLAMEVATSLLYVDAVLEDSDFNHPEGAERVRRLSERLTAVRRGAAPEPLEAWMEELYRRVADRQTMGSVVQELRASLAEAEKHIDEFFRNPEQTKSLLLVPKHLSAMRGVLSVLGMDHAAAALLRMRDDVDGMASTAIDTEKVSQAGVFDRIASNLGALGFLIDMLSVQPQMAKRLFVYDAQAGKLNPVMGRSEDRADDEAEKTQEEAPPPIELRLIEQAQTLAVTALHQHVPAAEVARGLEQLTHEAMAADQLELAATMREAHTALGKARSEDDLEAVRGKLSETLIDFVSSVSDGAAIEPETAALRRSPVPPPVATAPPRSALDEGDELREVFLEEAREVIGNAEEARRALDEAPGDVANLTAVRRAFHTLKGSSRMVGLKDFGEGAWICERIYNSQLAVQTPADAPLLEFTQWALDYLKSWIGDIAAHRLGGHSHATVDAAVRLLNDRRGGVAPMPETDITLPLAVAPAAAVPAPQAAGSVPVVPPHEAIPAAESATTAPSHAPQTAAPEAATPEAAMQADDTAPPGLPSFEPDVPAAHAEAPARGARPSELGAPSSFDMPAEFGAPESAFGAFDLPELPLELDNVGTAEATESPVSAPPPQPLPAARLPELTDVVPDVTTPPRGELPVLTTEVVDADNVKVVGSLRISIPLFNIFLNEADELSRRLTTELAEWAMELHRPVEESAIATAHSLAGSSSTVGYVALSELSRMLEHALMRSAAIGRGTADEARLFVDTAEELRRMLGQFAAGTLVEAPAALLARHAEHEITSGRRLDEATAAAEMPPSTRGGELTDLMLRPMQAEPAPPPAQDLPPLAPAPPAIDEVAQLDAEHTDFAALREPLPDFQSSGFVELKPFPEPLVSGRRSEPVAPIEIDIDEDIDAADAVDAELFPIFEEEAQELLPQLAAHLRDWVREPGQSGPAQACMRTLHTLKGGARLAGAMRLGEMAHRLESRIEHLANAGQATLEDVESLQSAGDALAHLFEVLRQRDAMVSAAAASALVDEPPAGEPAAHAPPPLPPLQAMPVPSPVAEIPQPDAAPPVPEPGQRFAAAPERAAADPVLDEPPTIVEPIATGAHPAGDVSDPPNIDWSRFMQAAGAVAREVTERQGVASHSAVRVRAPLLDRLVNQAGEVSITRSRIESEVGQIKGSLTDLTDNLERLRVQLRDIELQAETQMASRLEAAKAAEQAFDPLEFDRFTRFQEVTRMMAESVNDVATVQRTLQRALESTEDELASQARMTRELQDDLLRTRMVEFETLTDRFYRVVRQAAKETGKQVRLDITGGAIEVDRGVLDRMTGTFEHLLRNCVTHGIEPPHVRSAAGKDPTGSIAVVLTHEGNEVGVEFRDDGAGLNLGRIRAKGEAMGLLQPGAPAGDAELAGLIFTPGFSTADNVTELAGRGIGMDVVRSEVNAIGGRVETATRPSEGTSFKLVLPLTTAVTQVVMLRCGDTTVAVPSTLVEIVRRVMPDEVAQSYATGVFRQGERPLQFFWLGALLQGAPSSLESGGRTRSVVVMRSAQQRVALHVDEVLGNQEVVVKNLGPQLSRLPGLAGVTLLASGAVALIYNPVALAATYGSSARAATDAALSAPSTQMRQVGRETLAAAAAPLVLVVDDSLTVRRVTQRLLVREGYRVALAKDGMEALERLAEERPQVVLTDIEMPRMDGFDLVRNIRADALLKSLPVIMITSRIAQKHRDYASELGVDHYLGKPYAEDDLLALIGHYTAADSIA